MFFICYSCVEPIAFGQSDSEYLPVVNSFKIQLGYFRDYDRYTFDDALNIYDDDVIRDFSTVSLRRLCYGLIRENQNRLLEFNLEVSQFSNTIFSHVENFMKNQLIVELDYFRSLIIFNKSRHHFNAGVFFGYNYLNRKYSYYEKIVEESHFLSSGVKLNYALSLNSNLSILFSTKLNVLDFGQTIKTYSVENSGLHFIPIRCFPLDFIRNRFVFDFGLKYRMSFMSD